MKIKIAIADDHPLVINGLHHILANCADMEIMGSYTDGAKLLTGLAKQQPDVLLLDIQMPGQTGDQIAEKLHHAYPLIKILVLTNQDNVYYIKNMMRKGVLGYILKTTEGDILMNAIRTVSRGEQYLEPVLMAKVAKDTLQAKRQIAADPLLTRREKEVIRYLASDMTSQQIADKLFISKRTVDSCRLSLLTKLGVKNSSALVKKGIQLGLIE